MKRLLLTAFLFVVFAAPAFAQQSQYLGRLSTNPYDPASVSNPYGVYGSPYSATSINNPYSVYGSPYSTYSATNPYTMNAPRLYASDGTYLGRLSANPYDPESTSNPYGVYGSKYSATSINNRYGQYGNPYSAQAPIIIGGETNRTRIRVRY